MKRRTLLRWAATAAAILPLERVRLWAAPRDLTPQALDALYEIGATVLPASLGAGRVRSTIERFVVWTRGYREGVALAHGYGHPRLRKTPPSPVPAYNAQLSALADMARSRGARWSALDVEIRRQLLDAALTEAGVRNLPAQPNGQHVISDLMAFYFRSSEANDDCYRARIEREICRPIAVTIRRPDPLER